MSDYVLPEEVMLCILTRLPVKSLLRFKSVCKRWRELFGSRKFIKMHYHQLSTLPQNQHFIFRTPNDKTLSLVSIDSEANEPTILDVSYSKMLGICYINFVGCCNGLICISISDGFALWNPALRLFNYVPPGRCIVWRTTLDSLVTFGFGHDAEENDFKIVRILLTPEFGTKSADVYSSKSGSWKRVEMGIHFRTFCQVENNAIVNGNPYWVANVGEYDYGEDRNGEWYFVKDEYVLGLVRLNVTRMVFETVPLSGIHLGDNPKPMLQVVDWKGSLAALLLTTTDGDNLPECIDIWLMSDAEMIWTKIHTARPTQKHFTVVSRLLWCSKSGKVVELEDGKLFVTDPETGFVKSIKISGVEQCYPEIFGYNEGLTYIEGMKPELTPPDYNRG